MESYSPSKLNSFSECPFKYKCVYIDKLADEYATPKPYLVMGAHVHNTLKDFFDHPRNDRSLAWLERRLRERWLENREVFGGDKEEENIWGTKALQMIRVFYASQKEQSRPMLLEDFYDFEIDDKWKLIGRIDRADLLPDDSLHVIDYKTGKADEENANELQLGLYSLIVQSKIRKTVSKASYWYLFSNTWYTIDIDESRLQADVESAKEKIAKIKAEKDFHPRINKYCKWCDYLEICPNGERIKDNSFSDGA